MMVNRFREQRERRKISVEELSVKCGLSVKYIQNIEDSDFNVEEMYAINAGKIALALGCYIKDLIYS